MPGAVRLGDKVTAVDNHYRRCCPHHVTGKSSSVTGGSPDVFINGKPAVRLGDKAKHARCCGSNTFSHVKASIDVFVNDKGLVRLGDKTQHCGGTGKVVEGSQDVLVN